MATWEKKNDRCKKYDDVTGYGIKRTDDSMITYIKACSETKRTLANFT